MRTMIDLMCLLMSLNKQKIEFFYLISFREIVNENRDFIVKLMQLDSKNKSFTKKLLQNK